MKKQATFLVLAFLILLFSVGGYFLWTNVLSGSRSAITALAPAKEDLSGLLRSGHSPFSLPEGFTLEKFADIRDARDLEFGPDGSVFVSSPDTGRVVLFDDEDGDGVSDSERLVAENLNNPHGLLFRCMGDATNCRLYIAEEDKLSVFSYNPRTQKAINPRKLMDLPTGGRHTTRSVEAHPENSSLLLVSVGSTCNVCEEEDSRNGSVLFYNTQTGASGEYATGLRNAVFLEGNEMTGEVWVTEMGRDLLGDNLPPDEINVLERGGDYGWPLCYGKNVHDAEFDDREYIRDPCQEKIPSLIDIQAHSAPLGLDFIPVSEKDESVEENAGSTSELAWPKEYEGDLLVGLHGSWNRSTPVGYKVVRYDIGTSTGTASIRTTEHDFLTGFLTDDGRALGRPVDVLVGEDGVLYISDDKAGLVYSVRYSS